MLNTAYALAAGITGLCLALLIVAADYALLPPAESIMPLGDKAAHFVLVGGLALLANLAWPNRMWRVGVLRFMAGSIAVGLLITAEEVSQHWLVHRTFSWADLTANWLGVVAASLVAERLIRRRCRIKNASSRAQAAATTRS